MGKTEKQRRDQALSNWLRWTPIVVIPLAVLFADAWLQTQSWRRDFELGGLAEKRQMLRSALSEFRVDAASLHDLDRLEYMAGKMGMVEPDPTQIVAVNTFVWQGEPDIFAVASTRADSASGTPGFPAATTLPEMSSVTLSVLEDLPASNPVRGISLVTLETVEDDLDAEMPTFSGDASQ